MHACTTQDSGEKMRDCGENVGCMLSPGWLAGWLAVGRRPSNVHGAAGDFSFLAQILGLMLAGHLGSVVKWANWVIAKMQRWLGWGRCVPALEKFWNADGRVIRSGDLRFLEGWAVCEWRFGGGDVRLLTPVRD
ncbi:hypothetical protein BDV95DRAFT_570884 [Massariosphaeria phaeospora]|uniref:Uncharacterized protein n=1 Tax=Massariosphaeria phaeospora TaxID=100035 RepID=A0A7C8M6F1_9PLEO|nr:hypothetical protein BDV95DRAFT_570884 [Massariosphaeria phaeospora]